MILVLAHKKNVLIRTNCVLKRTRVDGFGASDFLALSSEKNTGYCISSRNFLIDQTGLEFETRIIDLNAGAKHYIPPKLSGLLMIGYHEMKKVI